jgi:hypothetical protein
MRVAIDTAQAQRAADVLEDGFDEYRDVGIRLMAGDPAIMPPAVAMHVVSELVEIEQALLRHGLELALEGALLRRRAFLFAASNSGTFALMMIPGSWSWGLDSGFGPGGLFAALKAAGMLGYKGGFRGSTEVGPFGLSGWGDGFAGLEGSFFSRTTLGPDGWHSVLEGSVFAGLRGGLGGRAHAGPLATEADVMGWYGVKASVKARSNVDAHGFDITEDVAASAGLGAAAHSRTGLSRAYVGDRLDAFAGARADAGGVLALRPDHVAAKGHAGAFAGVEAKRAQELRLGGLSSNSSVSVAYGVGASAGGGGELSLDRIGANVSGKIALGPGISFSVGGEIRPREVLSDVSGFARGAVDTGEHVSRAVGGALSHIHL